MLCCEFFFSNWPYSESEELEKYLEPARELK